MLHCLLLCTTLATPVPPVPAVPVLSTFEDEVERKEVKRLEAWPEPENTKELKKDIQRLRKASTEEMGGQADAALREVGAAAAPLLLKAFGKEKSEEALERIESVLVGVTAAEHTRLLAAELDSKSTRLRTWLYRRIAAFPDHGLAEEVGERLGALKRKGDKADPDELYAAALCALSTGQVGGLDVVFDVAKKSWGKHADEIRVAANEVRGPTATTALATQLAGTDRKARVAALRLLASCGDPEQAVPLIAPLLDENDNSIRIAAINALRGIIDGDPPLDKLPVFEAIEQAKKWKERVG
jgi:HEAT repeat protein